MSTVAGQGSAYSFFENQNSHKEISKLTADPSSPSLSVDQKKLVDAIKSCVQESEKYKSKWGYPTRIDKYDSLYLGDFYKDKSKESYECREDWYFYYVDVFKTMILSQKTKDEVVRIDDEEGDIKEEIYERILKDANQKNNSELKEEELCIDGGKYGNGIAYVYWDAEAENGQGYMKWKPIHPKYFGISPNAPSVDECYYCWYKFPVSTHQLQLCFPEFKDKLKPDAGITPAVKMNEFTLAVERTTDSVSGATAYFDPSRYVGLPQGSATQTNLTIFYYRDPDLISISTMEQLETWIQSNPGFGNPRRMQKAVEDYSKKLAMGPFTVKRYPFGRRILEASGNILEDLPCREPELPFVNFQIYLDARQFWARGIMEKSNDPIKNMHLVSRGMAANADHRNRPPYVTDDPDFDVTQQLQTKPGRVFKIRPQSTIKPLEVPPVGSKDNVELHEFRKGNIEKITGLNPTLTGVRQQGTYSGVQEEKQQDAAMGRLLPYFRRFNAARQEIGKRWLWMIQNIMDSERQFVFINQDDDYDPTQQPQSVFQFTANQIQANPDQPENPIIKNDLSKGEFAYVVQVGYGRPVSKAARFEMAKEVAQIIQPFAADVAAELLLLDSGHPQARHFADLVKQRFQQTQQAQAKQAQDQMNVQKQVVAKEQAQEDQHLDIKKVQAGAGAQKAQAAVLKTLAEIGSSGIPGIPANMKPIGIPVEPPPPVPGQPFQGAQ